MHINCNTVKVFFNCKNTDNRYRVSKIISYSLKSIRVYVAKETHCIYLLLGIKLKIA